MVFKDKDNFIDIYEEIKESINSNKIDLLIIPRFHSNSYKESKKYIEFFKENNVLVGISNYDRWFKYFPPLKFDYYKIIRGSFIIDWLHCQLVFKHIPSFFISEIHQNSANPLKKIIKNKTGKKVLDFPFKLMKGNYNPNLEYDFPVFVIPGKIEKRRRDYLTILKFFLNPSLKKYKWKLIILGRPIDHYGKKVFEMSDNINSLMGEKRVEYIENYISKNEFDFLMKNSTHILAPVTKFGYKFGKDSGALYDVFKYNKIGIFPDYYFYNDNLIEKKVILTYTDNDFLRTLLFSIISNNYSYSNINHNFREISSCFNKEKYINYIKKEITSL